MKKYWIGGIVCLLVLVALIAAEYFRFRNEELLVVFCDVGQGDGIFIRTPQGYDVVIDGGPDASFLNCLSSHMPFWDKSLDIVFLTHFDSDHYNGLLDVIDRYKIKTFVTGTIDKENGQFTEFINVFIRKGVEVREARVNEKVEFPDGVILTNYWPKDTIKGLSDNNTSLVQSLSYHDFDVLFTGDIDYGFLNPILERNGIQFEIFKLPHHGSRTGIDIKTLTLIRPDIVISSSGRENRYGHPHQEVISLVETSGAILKRTDIEADIVIKSNGEKYWVSK